jgi:hypothetical protein
MRGHVTHPPRSSCSAAILAANCLLPSALRRHSERSVPRLWFCAKRRDTQSKNLSSIANVPRRGQQCSTFFLRRGTARCARRTCLATCAPSASMTGPCLHVECGSLQQMCSDEGSKVSRAVGVASVAAALFPGGRLCLGRTAVCASLMPLRSGATRSEESLFNRRNPRLATYFNADA